MLVLLGMLLKKIFELKQENKLEQMGEKFYNFTSKRFSVQAFAESVNNVYKMYK